MLGSILLLKSVTDDWSLTVTKTAFVESVNLKTLVSHDVRSNCLIVQSMAHEHTPPIFHVASYEHEPKLPPSRAVVYCSTSCQGHAAATCAICVFLSRVLLQGSSLATNASAASTGSVKVDLMPRFIFVDKCYRRGTLLKLATLGPRTVM